MCGHHRSLTLAVALGLFLLVGAPLADAATADEINGSVDAALEELLSRYPMARVLAREAKGVLVFPDIVEGGLILGGLYGEGALLKSSGTAGYYSIAAGTIGPQVGLQKYGYALFFISDSALSYLERNDAWEVGVGPSVVIVDSGMASALTTITEKANVYAFFFRQQGLMAGIGLQGSKIRRLVTESKK
jgi:lipid-binding SYLF domain-containing protein